MGYIIEEIDRLVRLDEVDSTNAHLLRGKYPSGTAVIARRQTAGRGRRGRRWLDDEGNSFLFSAIFELKLAGIEEGSILLIPLAAGMATVTAASKAVELFDRPPLFDDGTIESLSLKWPNDVICLKHGVEGKVAGILVESEIYGDRVRAVIGIGLNLRGELRIHDREMLPPVSLLEGEEGTPEEFAAILIPELNHRIDQIFHKPGELLSDIRANFFLTGKQVEKEGVRYDVKGMGNDGGLILINPRGEQQIIYDADWDRIIDR